MSVAAVVSSVMAGFKTIYELLLVKSFQLMVLTLLRNDDLFERTFRVISQLKVL
jgi:hypothetical protein